MGLKQMIKQAVLNLIDDTGPYPRGQADYNGKTTDFLYVSPYGLESSPPPEGWVLLLSLQGQESVKAGFVSDFLNRIKNKLPGEVCLHNTLTGSNIFLRANGDVDITSLLNTNIIAAGNITLTATGTVNLISAGDVNLGALGGEPVARVGDSVAGGVITSGSAKVKAI